MNPRRRRFARMRRKTRKAAAEVLAIMRWLERSIPRSIVSDEFLETMARLAKEIDAWTLEFAAELAKVLDPAAEHLRRWYLDTASPEVLEMLVPVFKPESTE